MKTQPLNFDTLTIVPPATERIQRIETHISWVLLTGEYAYKIKKPVNFGFLDYTTQQKRRQFCEEEVRLNRRLAPDLYVEVVGITGSPDAPQINGEGVPFEYAVKMHQFDPEMQLDRLALTGEMVESLAVKMAAFHQNIAHADVDTPWGEPETLYAPMVDNFAHIVETEITTEEALGDLRGWLAERYEALMPLLHKRKAQGFIRECHGDMHLANMFWMNGEVQIFDGIEFNFPFRWIDVISELAFTLMDLEHRGQKGLATQLLNRYLEITGDYEGLKLLRFYQVYRAMVRAKVASMEYLQRGREASREQYQGYIDLARRYTASTEASLIIAHGFSGSGKTTRIHAMLQEREAIAIHSDIERKRLFGIGVLERGKDIYSAEASRMTYARLETLATGIVQAGFTVIVDATFLKHWGREHFHNMARTLGVPFAILDVSTPIAICEARIRQRQKNNTDASDATVEVLHRQVKGADPLTLSEQKYVI